jgi:myo-inositol-1-phosphate synthase
MSLRYSYQLHNAPQHLPCAHLLQELQAVEAEAEAVEAEEEAEQEEAEQEEADKQTPLTSDSAEILLKYSQEKERKQIASSPNSNATI